MEIGLSPKLTDLFNLVIAKGSNFALTAVLFSLIGKGMNAAQFAEFGYWWSMALMIGGVLFGGVASALIRVTATQGSLYHLIEPLKRAVFWFASLGLLLAALLVYFGYLARAADILVVILFGIAVQFQTVILALLRAMEAARENTIASIAIVIVIPVIVYPLMVYGHSQYWVFLSVAIAFMIGTIVAVAVGRKRLLSLLESCSTSVSSLNVFVGNLSAFTIINLFSYGIVVVDFTLFRQIGDADGFAVMATAKVYFERFVLPFFLVFAGAISLRVLRHSEEDADRQVRLHVGAGLTEICLVVLLLLFLSAGYRYFVLSIRGDSHVIGFAVSLCAATGYLLFAINGIMFDLLVVRSRWQIVFLHVVSFFVVGSTIQATAIVFFGVTGWAIGWLLFNILMLGVMGRKKSLYVLV